MILVNVMIGAARFASFSAGRSPPGALSAQRVMRSIAYAPPGNYPKHIVEAGVANADRFVADNHSRLGVAEFLKCMNFMAPFECSAAGQI